MNNLEILTLILALAGMALILLIEGLGVGRHMDESKTDMDESKNIGPRPYDFTLDMEETDKKEKADGLGA